MTRLSRSASSAVSASSASPLQPQHSPAAERNLPPILHALQRLLPSHGKALEIASGTGQHVAGFALGMPGWQWQPSDVHIEGFASVAYWCTQADVGNVAPAVQLDVLAPQWPAEGKPFGPVFDAVFCANMLHISPAATSAALMAGAARCLAPNGLLIIYGPFLEQDVPTAQSNLDFDHGLRQRNPAWGLRPLHEVVQHARNAGLQLRERMDMPANNLLLVFGR